MGLKPLANLQMKQAECVVVDPILRAVVAWLVNDYVGIRRIYAPSTLNLSSGLKLKPLICSIAVTEIDLKFPPKAVTIDKP